MDELDRLLVDAWNRVLHRLRDDPYELARRAARLRSSTHRRPLRGWSLVLRASDTRIRHEVTAFFDESLAADYLPHEVTVTGEGLRSLVQPVILPRGGMRWTQVARLLGMHDETLRHWMKRGVFDVSYEPCRPNGYQGKPCPYLKARGPLDPTAELGRPPDPLWGSLWQSRHTRIPDGYEITLRRVPRFSPYKGERRFRGWDWECPARRAGIKGTGNRRQGTVPTYASHASCRGTTSRLYLPLTAWTLPRVFGPDALRKLLGDAAPGLDHLFSRLTIARHHRFACHACWKLRYTDFANPKESWNQFITHISAGLLHGHEVAKPTGFRESRTRTRRRNYRPCPNRPPSQRREQILELLLTTRDTAQRIAEKLGVAYDTVTAHTQEIYRQHNVHGRNALARSLGRPLPLPPELGKYNHTSTRGARLTPKAAHRRGQVARLYPLGLTSTQIATHLNASIHAIRHDIRTLRQRGQLPLPTKPRRVSERKSHPANHPRLPTNPARSRVAAL